MSLSDKIFDFYNIDAIEVEDVREFIVKLKKRADEELPYSEHFIRIIEKEAGGKLIK